MSPLRRPDSEREELSERIAILLHWPVTILGVIFLVVVIGEFVTPAGTPVHRAFFIGGWVLWGLFVLEFVTRMVIAPSTRRFLRRNWWQVIFLIVPFLRLLSLLRVSRAGLRVSRTGRVVASAVRAGRSARANLTARLGWLISVTLIVILGSAELLFQLGVFPSMATALHAATMATITGVSLGSQRGIAQALDVVLGIYSVVVFATLAGSLGAFFLERREERRSALRSEDPERRTHEQGGGGWEGGAHRMARAPR